ncbi:hypothetical protein N7481_001324 [Penicillium waksmanii]|uniref:uncharacterized protein n=1 Tax=Penicillium waksmanii TaxID=69791 RepID=UPI0025483B79|nr:uncharacterized protein N7481_001324 [Penicillium waksmanii]KAJ6000915.1 hypothetical protein N7481_001324 [Penicillium waksmanii]
MFKFFGILGQNVTVAQNAVALEIVSLCYTNGLFSGHGAPRAFVSFTPDGSLAHPKLRKAAQIRVILPRPIKIDAGQYINLWTPSVGFWSWIQTHPL